MKPESRRRLIDRIWDMAARQCCRRIKAEPHTKELRDLVYILEHLNNMLPDQKSSSNKLEVIFDVGDDGWNE